MALVRAEAMFKIFPEKVVYEQKVKLRPNEHYYDGKNGKPYTTYSCQICDQLFGRISGFYFGEDDERKIYKIFFSKRDEAVSLLRSKYRLEL